MFGVWRSNRKATFREDVIRQIEKTFRVANSEVHDHDIKTLCMLNPPDVPRVK